MTNVLLKACTPSVIDSAAVNLTFFIRNGHHLRGKPPGIARTLQERLTEINYKDPALYYKVDIGLPYVGKYEKSQLQERLNHFKTQRQNPEMERLARTQKLLIDLDKSNEDWLTSVGPKHLKQVAEHYGVFEHLFGDAYFYPKVPLSIFFMKGDTNYPVYYGNVLKPEDANQKPQVGFNCEDKDTLWTLVMTNPDGHFVDNDKEYVHWFVGNIPGNKIENGETIIEYLQPFPPKGTGYHRFIFILYKQDKKLDFSKYKKTGACLNLNERTFKTYDFYKALQDDITPAGLAFFQSDWSTSLKDFYHKVLDMKEPIFEYDFPPPYLRKQEWFPKRQPFNLYMDRYRDPKQINKEFLMRKMKKVHPFQAPAPPLPYPNAQSLDPSLPTWLKLEMTKSRMKWGRINEIEK
ncbi:39S ribosomal protein L38, mitochondrial [Anthonomus grandis grandis]|uniref:39S ribosomal protein L38, mitochondrial n=1 Tax=Anthonomus grandis grandis TaxID=2921223 RepID=UPI0021663400|nr:39S ribosomal protein L38, mitochondrial [Anthonomus grandis grandis]